MASGSFRLRPLAHVCNLADHFTTVRTSGYLMVVISSMVCCKWQVASRPTPMTGRWTVRVDTGEAVADKIAVKQLHLNIWQFRFPSF